MPIYEIAQWSAVYPAKTNRMVLETPTYAPCFAMINRAGHTVNGEAVSCRPNKGCC